MIERRADQLLVDYARLHSLDGTPPIPIEKIVEDFLGLRILWEPIPETSGVTVLAKLTPAARRIILNETHVEFIMAKPFLYNTILAHETGHWDLDVERGTLLQRTALAGFTAPEYIFYRADDVSAQRKKNAHRFMAYLLMPKRPLYEAVAQTPIHGFPDLYRLRDQFAVTVTTLQIRLEELGLVYIDADGNFHESRQVFDGQLRLL